jgi:hypothetical protein
LTAYRAGGINDLQRDEAASHLLSMTAQFGFSDETFFLGLDYLDRFLSHVKVQARHLQLLVVSCFMVASKLTEEDEDHATLAELVELGHQAFSAQDLLRMERIVCDKLAWDLTAATPFNFLHQYAADPVVGAVLDAGAGAGVLRDATCTLEHTALYDFLQYPASLRALAALADAAGARLGSPAMGRVVARMLPLVGVPEGMPRDTAWANCLADIRFVLAEIAANK